MTNVNDADATALTILVDADATPRQALVITDRLAQKYAASVITVSSVNHQYDRPGHVSVDPHPQAVDMEIVRRVQRGRRFIVVTQDYGLAALVLGKGAQAISPHGLVYTEANIDRLLFERDLHARQRRASGRSRGPKARTREDDERFSHALETLIQTV